LEIEVDHDQYNRATDKDGLDLSDNVTDNENS